MKILPSFISFIFLFISTLNAQTKITLDGPSTVDLNKSPMAIVNNFKTDLNHALINPDNIDSIKVFKDSSFIITYGMAAQYGVILVYISKKAEMLKLADILKIYNLTETGSHLKIFLNSQWVRNPELIYIEKSELVKAEIIYNQPVVTSDSEYSVEPFVKITTIDDDQKQ